MAGAEAEAQRLIQIALLGEAIDFLPLAVFVFDEEGRYVAVNGHASELLGYSRDELLQLRIGDLADSPATALQAYADVAEQRTLEATTHARRKDGSVLRLRFRGGATLVAGMPFYVGVAWEAIESA
jgi:PAS domain S-box-containing protein